MVVYFATPFDLHTHAHTHLLLAAWCLKSSENARESFIYTLKLICWTNKTSLFNLFKSILENRRLSWKFRLKCLSWKCEFSRCTQSHSILIKLKQLVNLVNMSSSSSADLFTTYFARVFLFVLLMRRCRVYDEHDKQLLMCIPKRKKVPPLSKRSHLINLYIFLHHKRTSRKKCAR